ncbi:MAG: lytic murein transglycosylase [Pseudomonadota bacterium]|jgi:membrane-bound lytic murein transglycosylase B
MPLFSLRPRSRHHPLAFALGLPLWLAACAHAPSPDLPAPPANLAQAAATAVPAASETQGVAQAQGVGPAQVTIQTLPANPEPDSYAFREDARVLAQQLAQQQALDPAWAWQTLQRAKFKESVTRFIMPPPAGTAKNWTAYRARFVEPIRIRAGLQFWREQRENLSRAELTYGVPASVIVGVLGVETIYGRQMGSFRALDALATLSLDFPRGRSDRSEFFRSELGQLLKWCQQTSTSPDSVMASYAGAVGMPQFMPSSILRFAVDFDGDGRIDLTRSAADAIGSVAHYLARQGWVSGLPGYYEVRPPAPGLALQQLLEPDILPTFTAEEMTRAGATLAGQPESQEAKLALVALQNGEGPTVYVAGTANFYAVTRYNQSSYYALAVLQLGEAVQREAERVNLTLK